MRKLAVIEFVTTRTLTSVDWPGSHVLGGDVVASVNDLKQQGDGHIVVLDGKVVRP